MKLEQDHLWAIKPSQIQGYGAFITKPIKKNSFIDIGIVFHARGLVPEVTYFGGKLNHSFCNNVILRYSESTKTYNLYASKDLEPWTELLLDYNDTPFYIKGPEKTWGTPPKGYNMPRKLF
jgi:hypothetical protein